MDDDGFQRQGRGSGKAWGPAGKADSAAARPNAWAQGSSSVRVCIPQQISRFPDCLVFVTIAALPIAGT